MEDSTDRPTKQLFIPQPAIPTIKIVDDDAPDGYVIINQSDFDKATMKKFVEKKSDAPPAA